MFLQNSKFDQQISFLVTVYPSKNKCKCAYLQSHFIYKWLYIHTRSLACLSHYIFLNSLGSIQHIATIEQTCLQLTLLSQSRNVNVNVEDLLSTIATPSQLGIIFTKSLASLLLYFTFTTPTQHSCNRANHSYQRSNGRLVSV